MKSRAVIIFIGAMLSIAAGIFFLSEDLITPYVPFAEAAASPGKYVQIIGKIDRTSKIEIKTDGFNFAMTDKDGSPIRVVSKESKPLNFEHAEQAVVLGRYDASAKYFTADRILVKCPSKYERKI